MAEDKQEPGVMNEDSKKNITNSHINGNFPDDEASASRVSLLFAHICKRDRALQLIENFLVFLQVLV